MLQNCICLTTEPLGPLATIEMQPAYEGTRRACGHLSPGGSSLICGYPVGIHSVAGVHLHIFGRRIWLRSDWHNGTPPHSIAGETALDHDSPFLQTIMPLFSVSSVQNAVIACYLQPSHWTPALALDPSPRIGPAPSPAAISRPRILPNAYARGFADIASLEHLSVHIEGLEDHRPACWTVARSRSTGVHVRPKMCRLPQGAGHPCADKAFGLQRREQSLSVFARRKLAQWQLFLRAGNE
jgi:hypothetical protein